MPRRHQHLHGLPGKLHVLLDLSISFLHLLSDLPTVMQFCPQDLVAGDSLLTPGPSAYSSTSAQPRHTSGAVFPPAVRPPSSGPCSTPSSPSPVCCYAFPSDKVSPTVSWSNMRSAYSFSTSEFQANCFVTSFQHQLLCSKSPQRPIKSIFFSFVLFRSHAWS
jgi:hypothetical protein